MQRLLMGLQGGREATPGTHNYNPWPLWIEARRKPDPWRRLWASRGRERSRSQMLLLLERGVQRLLEGQVEVNRSWRPSA